MPRSYLLQSYGKSRQISNEKKPPALNNSTKLFMYFIFQLMRAANVARLFLNLKAAEKLIPNPFLAVFLSKSAVSFKQYSLHCLSLHPYISSFAIVNMGIRVLNLK